MVEHQFHYTDSDNPRTVCTFLREEPKEEVPQFAISSQKHTKAMQIGDPHRVYIQVFGHGWHELVLAPMDSLK